MERDGNSKNSTHEADLVPTDNPQTTEVISDATATAHIQIRDFSSAPPSQDDAVREKREGQAWESLGGEPAPDVLPADLGPGFVDVNGDVGGSGHNETVVDVIAVPCPGADPINTWTFGHETSGDASAPDLLDQVERIRDGAGSSYMSMTNLKESIQDLLQLQRTLPRSLTDEINVRNLDLIALHDEFVDMASEFRLWSFYETQESTLSGSAAGFPSDVQFGAPLVSVKSALLEVWQEDVYAVDSDHAHLASFGPSNSRIMESYLADFAQAIKKAAQLNHAHRHTPLHLKSLVKVEVIGFYEDPEAMMASPRQQQGGETGSMIRLYSTKHSYKEFIKKGPDRCLAERLHKGPKRRSSKRSVSGRSETEPSASDSKGEGAGLGLRSQTTDASQSTTTTLSPNIIITTPTERPPLLKVPAQSEPTFRPPSPDSIASVSTTMSEPTLTLPFSSDFTGEDAHTIDLLAQQQAKSLVKQHGLTATAGFLRPSPSLKKFSWIHMPFNNPVWVKEIFATLGKTQGLDFSRLFDYDNWTSKQIQNRNSESQPAYLKAICKYLSAADRLNSPRIPSPLFGPVNMGITPNCLYLYLPYLHFDTYQSMIRRRKLVMKRRCHGRAKPVPRWVEQESLELKVIWEYIGFDPPLNCRRTLDQFGHHSLRDTNSRDDDQMLYKLTKKDTPAPWRRMANLGSTQSSGGRSMPSAKGSTSSLYDGTDVEFGVEPGSELKDGHVLMVDQLWLWSIDMTTLVTFFSRRESNPTEGTLFQQADLRSSVYNELNGDLTGRTENTLDLAALIVWHAVTVLLDRSSHPDLEIFRVFDEAIGMLAERMTLNMKQFRINALDMEPDDEDESDESDAEGESPTAIKKRHRRELERSERENRENTSALLELRDLEDELSTLQKLFEMQDSTIRQMKEIYTSKDFKDSTKNGQDYLEEALEYLDDYKQQTVEMLKRVDTTRNDYEKMLEMVQRQAQVDEVRWSRLQAELASSQNLSVMIFTTFTVIFLPLTFFTGLFGMNTIEWQEEDIPSLKEIGAISLPASILLIIVSLVAAFSWRVQSTFKATYKGIKTSWKVIKNVYSERLEPTSRKEAKRIRREEKKRRHREAKMALDDQSYDFWAMVKRQQRDVQYQIPEQNVTGSTSVDVSKNRKRS
ncbi:hypothetical protein CHGG_08970 [Chaetomium globosum CBS 148.51]|uniref:Uncharacterized protein n=1 Tax=Chaetomium globosum (strain ATCC 6205 / CBS 148.51 / DSM 1962 / NBRC 6347 / NRRL 1970) TaxID=306901 RepID=Q2GST4_CHAGB|nr:uncharacterized protein CHGG_08970 [Chaetomium globosum CBS 148.51]EAQ84956.1 hypothetical protein CHGG_08970 [Chaetomium globosum CBS 148.51]